MSTPGEKLRLSECKFARRSCGFFHWCPQKGCEHTCASLQQSAWTLVHIQMNLVMEEKKRGRTGGRNGVEGKIPLPSRDKGADRHYMSPFCNQLSHPGPSSFKGHLRTSLFSSIPEILSTERSYKWDLLTPPSPPTEQLDQALVSLTRGPVCL